ncbi:OmpA family protein [Hymenobacter sp. 15J16-1T3B]|uniref:OmpA family protein n=1 Tax=Hymenobacter sp. 15J16-1T3B TaxID=2886941 RepID=UPI001D1197D2|nr:OmpA family protein [Hymenobacter sp. 15J16-1T3B]MCC3159320.1 OmpA family protein [Hymenobacter sp. 15J16-1T3B]
MDYLISFRVALCWGGLLLTGPTAFAQSIGPSIAGSVQSIESQGVSKALVTVVHVPSGAKKATTTDGSGKFVLANLTAGGPYVVQVSQPGFQSRVADNVFLTTDQPTKLTFTLTRPGDKSAARASASTATPREATAPAPVAAPLPAPQLTAQVAAPASGASAGEPARTYAYKPRAAYTPRKPAPVVKPATSGHYDAKSGNYIYETGAPVTLKLAGGSQLSGVGQMSTESLLYRFITDPAAQVDTVDLTRGWVNFDRVFFEPGKATLTPDSRVQLGHIAQLLRAYPNVRIKLGGYTDSTGAYKVNRLLSEARAQAAWATLVEMGVGASRMDARGYGPRYAIAPNTSEEGRAMNRRLSIKVLQK